MNPEEVRELFPHIARGITYFNHAATAPLSKRVLNILDQYLRERSEGNIDDYPALVKIVEETKEIIASSLNTVKERIAFVDNTTNGLNIVAEGLHWEPGDEIILNDIEFPANVYPFLNLRKKGVKIEFVKSHNGIVSAEDIVERITSRTKLVSVSMVQFLSGYKIDLEKLGEVCKSRKIILCVDAIQGLGALRLDVKRSNIDFISCGVQKWMLAIQGLAFIYVTGDLQQKIDPVYIGWLGVKGGWNFLDYNLDLKDSADRFQPGSLNAAGIYAVNASVKLFRDYGFDAVEERVISNSKLLISELKKIGINPLLSEVDDKFLSGIVAFKHSNAYSILEMLKSEKIEAAVREGLVRISPHFYNDNSDIYRLIEALKGMN